jgi:hypothetical protein
MAAYSPYLSQKRCRMAMDGVAGKERAGGTTPAVADSPRGAMYMVQSPVSFGGGEMAAVDFARADLGCRYDAGEERRRVMLGWEDQNKVRWYLSF